MQRTAIVLDVLYLQRGSVCATVVSTMVAEYLQSQMTTDFSLSTTLHGHKDVRVFTPDSGPESVIRDAAGRILGVRRLNEYEPLDKSIIARHAKCG